MKLSIDSNAAAWFKKEMDLDPGSYVRFYVRYGGVSPIQSGFSLGINVDEPFNPALTKEIDGITYFIEENDIWYFDGHNLSVTVDEDLEEIKYLYEK